MTYECRFSNGSKSEDLEALLIVPKRCSGNIRCTSVSYVVSWHVTVPYGALDHAMSVVQLFELLLIMVFVIS